MLRYRTEIVLFGCALITAILFYVAFCYFQNYLKPDYFSCDTYLSPSERLEYYITIMTYSFVSTTLPCLAIMFIGQAWWELKRKKEREMNPS